MPISPLPLAISAPVARGTPGEGYPYEWSVMRWLDSDPLARHVIEQVLAD